MEKTLLGCSLPIGTTLLDHLYVRPLNTMIWNRRDFETETVVAAAAVAVAFAEVDEKNDLGSTS